jgi:hypothetical protein
MHAMDLRATAYCRVVANVAGSAASILIALFLFTTLASAEAPVAAPTSTMTLYRGHGVDSDLLQLPKAIVTNSLSYQPSYFIGIGYQRGTPTPRFIEWPLDALGAGNVTTAWELVGVRHWGLQRNSELNVAYTIRTPHAHLGPIRARIGFSLGLSYAFGEPTFEDGPKHDPDRRYRLQNYNAYEIEWSTRGNEHVAIVTRIHHRSGVYGLIAPRRVGSNFVTTGIRYQW